MSMGTAVIGLISAVSVVIIEKAFDLIRDRLARRDQKADTETEQEKLTRNAIMVILHDRLYQACRYYIGQGDIDESGLDNIEALYDAYHRLGGNGTGTRLYQTAVNLPIKED